jgi:DNA-binding GntR family transcriptional regulator
VEHSGRPAFEVLAEELRNGIRQGTYASGSQLPSQSELMAQHNVSNTVVRSALQLLKSEGLVYGQQGKGVFVAEPGSGPAPATPDLVQLAAQVEKLTAAVEQLTERVASLEGRG